MENGRLMRERDEAAASAGEVSTKLHSAKRRIEKLEAEKILAMATVKEQTGCIKRQGDRIEKLESVIVGSSVGMMQVEETAGKKLGRCHVVSRDQIKAAVVMANAGCEEGCMGGWAVLNKLNIKRCEGDEFTVGVGDE
jgi:hypothetical protein